MKTAALCLAIGALSASATPELVFQSSTPGIRGGTHCNVVMEGGVLVSSCDITHGKTGFASLQAEIEGLKAENAALRSAHTAAIDALEARLMAAIDKISLAPGPPGAKGDTGAAGAQGHRGPAGAVPNMNKYVIKNRLSSGCCSFSGSGHGSMGY